MTNKLTNARLKNASEYWKMLRDVSQHKCDILLEDFVNHFKDINNMNKTHCNLYEPGPSFSKHLKSVFVVIC